jgi:hypothetical protein
MEANKGEKQRNNYGSMRVHRIPIVRIEAKALLVEGVIRAYLGYDTVSSSPCLPLIVRSRWVPLH